jgi:hypothetical protein
MYRPGKCISAIAVAEARVCNTFFDAVLSGYFSTNKFQ